jgi:hypothetical protein
MTYGMPARCNPFTQYRAHDRAPADGQILRGASGYILAGAEATPLRIHNQTVPKSLTPSAHRCVPRVLIR